ncbi:MAG: TCP-1/cpn60 chaperonin family protein [Chloroflexi bacterium]|nr:TCP-1/cpn60 chaperonin family protein [Chloroflexota bacterium]
MEKSENGTLLSAHAAVMEIYEAVAPTLGPNGLMVMLVDKSGGVRTTASGVAALEYIRAGHPAAAMLVSLALSQHRLMGDGTTTAAIIAASLVDTGTGRIIEGASPARLVRGIQKAMDNAVSGMETRARKIRSVKDKILKSVVDVAVRGDAPLSKLLFEAAGILKARLKEKGFRFPEAVRSWDEPGDLLFPGMMIDDCYPAGDVRSETDQAGVLILSDYIEEEPDEDSLPAIPVLASDSINVILSGRGIPRVLAEALAKKGVVIFTRIPPSELEEASCITGAKIWKGRIASLGSSDIRNMAGHAGKIRWDDEKGRLWISGALQKPAAVMLIGGSTRELGAERERVAKDGAAALQSAISGGVVPGGGANEIAMFMDLEKLSSETAGHEHAGVECFREAILCIPGQLAVNGGINGDEAVKRLVESQKVSRSDGWGVIGGDAELKNAEEEGVFDPVPIKIQALKTAVHTACAILKTHIILSTKDTGITCPDPSDYFKYETTL